MTHNDSAEGKAFLGCVSCATYWFLTDRTRPDPDGACPKCGFEDLREFTPKEVAEIINLRTRRARSGFGIT